MNSNIHNHKNSQRDYNISKALPAMVLPWMPNAEKKYTIEYINLRYTHDR